MRLRDFVLTATVACAVGWFGGTVWSEDPSPEVDLTQPGEEHARLKPFVGEWVVVGSGPGGDSKAAASIVAIYGGRYLAIELKGNVGELPYESRGLIAYDRTAKRWNSVMIDNYSTNIVFSEGVEKEKGKVWEFKGKFVGTDGKPVELRDVYKVVSDKEFTVESSLPGSEPMKMRFTKK